jgi:hypothetical protein
MLLIKPLEAHNQQKKIIKILGFNLEMSYIITGYITKMCILINKSPDKTGMRKNELF